MPVGTYDAPVQPWATAFEHEIYLKENAAWLLEQELKRIDPKQEIAIGTATDPYQPIERRVGITRSLLEVLARREGYRVGIVTKSTLIERDIDLLKKIAEGNTLVVHITITTTDAALARKLEPRAPRPDLRFATVKKLREAGIVTGVLCSPLLPGINDTTARAGRGRQPRGRSGCELPGSAPAVSEVVLAPYVDELRSRALPSPCSTTTGNVLRRQTSSMRSIASASPSEYVLHAANMAWRGARRMRCCRMRWVRRRPVRWGGSHRNPHARLASPHRSRMQGSLFAIA